MERERLAASERPTDAQILLYEEGIEDRCPHDYERDVDEVNTEEPVVRQGVPIAALQDLVPETADLLRRNEYIRALVQYIQMAVWFPSQEAVRSHLLGAGLEVETFERIDKWICSPALREEKHAHDDKKLSQYEIEQRDAAERKQQEADVEYTLAQMSQHQHKELSFEEKEEIEGIIEDALQVVVELESGPGQSLRICKWNVVVA